MPTCRWLRQRSFCWRESCRFRKRQKKAGLKNPPWNYSNSSPLKMDGWKLGSLSFWVKRPIFRGKLAVSFRECKVQSGPQSHQSHLGLDGTKNGTKGIFTDPWKPYKVKPNVGKYVIHGPDGNGPIWPVYFLKGSAERKNTIWWLIGLSYLSWWFWIIFAVDNGPVNAILSVLSCDHAAKFLSTSSSLMRFANISVVVGSCFWMAAIDMKLNFLAPFTHLYLKSPQ